MRNEDVSPSGVNLNGLGNRRPQAEFAAMRHLISSKGKVQKDPGSVLTSLDALDSFPKIYIVKIHR